MKTYAIKEIFDTVQGEGARTGARSVFMRMAGCNAWNGIATVADRAKGKGACARWCDTDFAKGTPMTAGQCLAALNKEWPAAHGVERWVVITGGEPMLQFDHDLRDALQDDRWCIAMETNGSIAPPTGIWTTVSPKLGIPLAHDLPHVSEVKVVLPGAVGGEAGWTDNALVALEGAVRASRYYVQPQDPIDQSGVELSHLHRTAPVDLTAQYNANVQQCLAFVKRNPRWRVSFQAHKPLDVR